MCMWEGQSLGLEGETEVMSKWPLVLFPCSSVLQSLMGMACPLSHEWWWWKVTLFQGPMCQALCCGLVPLRTLLVACYGKTNSSLLGGKAEIHWTCTWKIQVLVLDMTGSYLLTVFLWVVSFGTATPAADQEATSSFRPHLTSSSPTTEERGWMAVIVLRCFLTYISPVGIFFFSPCGPLPPLSPSQGMLLCQGPGWVGTTQSPKSTGRRERTPSPRKRGTEAIREPGKRGKRPRGRI